MTTQLATLGDICEFRYGKSLPASRRQSGSAKVYGSNGPVGTHVESLVDGPAIVVGRKGSYGEVHYSDGPLWPIDTTYYIDSGATDCDLKWLHFLLQHLPLRLLNKSAAIPGLNREDAYRLPVLLPPLDEQRRIATILDKADALRRKRKRALELLDGLTQSIFLEMFGSIFSKKANSRLADIAEIQVGYPFKSAEYSESNGIKLCRGTNVLPSRMDWSDLALWPTERGQEFSEYHLRSGDIVIAMDRPWISTGFKAARLLSKDLPALLVQRVARLRPKVEVDGYFLFALVQSSFFSSHFKPTETTVPHISPLEVRNFSFSLPQLAERKRFASRTTKIRQILDASIKDLDCIDCLFSSLQHRAFSGEL